MRRRPVCKPALHLPIMDEPTHPTSGGFSPEPAAAASSWRLAAVDGVLFRGFDLDRSTARRSAAFVAHVAGVLERTRRRRF